MNTDMLNEINQNFLRAINQAALKYDDLDESERQEVTETVHQMIQDKMEELEYECDCQEHLDDDHFYDEARDLVIEELVENKDNLSGYFSVKGADERADKILSFARSYFGYQRRKNMKTLFQLIALISIL